VGNASVGGVNHASLWSGTAASWVDLGPGYAHGVYCGQQVGWAGNHASLWSGTAASCVDLNPAGATDSMAFGVYGGQQVGYASMGGLYHAGLWSGSASSWVDLQVLLPSDFTSSSAQSVWNDGVFTYVAGWGHNSVVGRPEALMWVGPVPEPASGLMMIAGVAVFALLRHRRR
jgi:hypothetical protein